MWNKCDSSVLSWLDAKFAQKNVQKPTWLARRGATHFERQRTPAAEEGCDRLLSKYKWELLPHAPYGPDMSPPDFDLLRLIPQVKRAHAWTLFSLPGRVFCSGYPSHPRTKQKWYPKWNSKSSETLGRDHCEAGRLHRRNVKRCFLK